MPIFPQVVRCELEHPKLNLRRARDCFTYCQECTRCLDYYFRYHGSSSVPARVKVPHLIFASLAWFWICLPSAGFIFRGFFRLLPAMHVRKSCLKRHTPWAMVTQYYHLNARLCGEPQGAVGPVDDSSHLHLWLKLYYSLFPSISPFTPFSRKNLKIDELGLFSRIKISLNIFCTSVLKSKERNAGSKPQEVVPNCRDAYSRPDCHKCLATLYAAACLHCF